MARARMWILAVVACVVLGPQDSAWAAKYLTQPGCTPGATGYCTQVDASATKSVVVRTLTFNPPAPGSVFVQFNGSMLCSSRELVDSVVDVATQIRTDSNAADSNGAGGQRYAMTLKQSSEHTLFTTYTFNMASTRVLAYSSGGNKTVRLMLTPLRMDKRTLCGVVNASFSVALP